MIFSSAGSLSAHLAAFINPERKLYICGCGSDSKSNLESKILASGVKSILSLLQNQEFQRMLKQGYKEYVQKWSRKWGRNSVFRWSLNMFCSLDSSLSYSNIFTLRAGCGQSHYYPFTFMAKTLFFLYGY